MNVLVTGATGFIGRVIARDLAEAGHSVSALVRNGAARDRLGDLVPSARPVLGDLLDEASLARATEGQEAVVHLAAIVSPVLQADAAAVQRVNRDATVRLGELAHEASARRFVFVSSIAAMGFWSGVATAESACHPVSAYGQAKLEAERRLFAMASPDFSVTVLRPPTVYGPGEPYNFLAWVRAIDSGVFRIIGRGDNTFPMATTENVARAVRAATLGQLPDPLYLVADREPYSVARIHRAALRALGKKPPRVRVPRNVALLLGVANEGAARVVPKIPLLLTRARVRTLTVSQRFDVEPLLSRGVALDAPLEDWVERTVRDYRKRGLIA